MIINHLNLRNPKTSLKTFIRRTVGPMTRKSTRRVLGHTLLRSLVRSHCPHICSLRTARFVMRRFHIISVQCTLPLRIMSGFQWSRFKRRATLHPRVQEFQKYFSIILLIKACISYLIDVGSDLLLAIRYALAHDVLWSFG